MDMPVYKRCSHCGQWISPIVNHYVKVRDSKGSIHYLHWNPCLNQYADDHYFETLEERVNDHR